MRFKFLEIHIKQMIKLLLLLIGSLLFGVVYADPPRPLNTTFADYAQQQKRHDEQLTSQKSTMSTHASSPVSTQPNSQKTIEPKISKSKGSKGNTPVNINQADEAGLSAALTGIGPAKARAIVDYRREHGPFKTVGALIEVKGIGPATLEKNRQFIRLN